MNRRTCINCETTWNSLTDDELEGPHICPQCGDQLSPINRAQGDPETPLARVAPRP